MSVSAPGFAAETRITATDRRPVMLLTVDVPFDPEGVRVAIDAAGEAGSELLICDVIPLAVGNPASRPGRSHLFTNVSTGILRERQTSNSLSVCGSRPFAASSSMTAASTAARTR